MVNKLNLFKDARGLGSTKTLTEIGVIVDSYNYADLKAAKLPNYKVELYDKVSPINGIPSEVVMNDEHEIGEIYLISVNGNLVFMQKHDPEQMGFVPMTAERAISLANIFVDKIIESEVDSYVYEQVLTAALS